MMVETADLWLGMAWKAASIVALLVSAAVGILILRMKTEFASTASHTALAALIDGHDTRLTIIERDIKNTATSADLEKLRTSMAEISGKQDVTNEKIGRVADAEKTTSETVRMIHDHLMRGSRAA